MKLQKISSYTKKAIDDYNMIDEDDKIAVGISGGKDSLSLLYALTHLKRYYHKTYKLEAITVDMGFEDSCFSNIQNLCDKLDVHYTVIKTDIAEIIFDIRKERNPCSLCAKLRKGAFNKKAKELGCNKKAYAHHCDDVIETAFMSLIYEGRFHCFSPVTYLDRSDITLIRPLIYVDEQDIINFRDKYKLPVVASPCHFDGHTKREYVKQLINAMNDENLGLRQRLFHAVQTSTINGWNVN